MQSPDVRTLPHLASSYKGEGKLRALPHPHSLFGNAPPYKGEGKNPGTLAEANHSVNKSLNIYNSCESRNPGLFSLRCFFLSSLRKRGSSVFLLTNEKSNNPGSRIKSGMTKEEGDDRKRRRERERSGKEK